ncbi:MAG: hypothetical protein ABII06_01310, partial [Pseudomonadota bacterium]
NACDILADSLRNTITKSGLIFSLIKQEIGFLRDQWEELLIKESKGENLKVLAIRNLNELLLNMKGAGQELRDDLVEVQSRFLHLSLPPENGEKWVDMQIEERWKNFLDQHPQSNGRGEAALKIIKELKAALRFGQHPDIISDYSLIPDDLKLEWVNLLYGSPDSFNAEVIERLVHILDHPGLAIPSRHRSRKTLTQLKAVAETMNQLERNTNFLLRQVLNGGKNGKVIEVLNGLAKRGDKGES